jgi:MFS family permease
VSGGRLGALREREFRLFFVGQTVSLLGDGMVGVALSFAVLDLTGSVSDLGFVFAARSLPLVGFLLVGGVFADRLSRRAVMIGADVVRLGSQGLTAGLLISGHAQVWELAGLQAISGLASAFFYPSVTGLTPALVGGEHLQQANVLRGISGAAGSIAGPAIAGALVATVGSGWALAADAASFGVSAAFLASLRLPPHERLEAQAFLRDLRDGWAEFRARTWLWTGVIAAGLVNMLWAPFFVLGPAIARSSLGGPGAWALIVSCSGAGSFAGGLLALRLRPRRPFRAAFIAFLPYGSPMALLALRAPAPAVAALALAGGAGLMIGNALWETTLQEQISPATLSRVTSYDWFGSLAGQPLGMALVGPVAVAIGTRPTLWAAAALISAINLTVLSLPSVRAVEARPRPGAAAASGETGGW